MPLPSLISGPLQKLGLRRPLKRARDFLFDGEFREATLDLYRDYNSTRALTSGLRKEGVERADPQQEVLIISQSNLPFYIKFHGLLAKAIQLRGLTPVILTYSHNKLATRYLQLLGIPDIIFWDHFARDFAPDPAEVKDVVNEFLDSKPGVQEIKHWNFRGVFAAKQALSRAIRRTLQGQFSLDNPQQAAVFKEQLTRAVESVFLAERLLSTRPVVKVLARDAGYTPNGAIYETALRKGIDSVRVEMGLMRGCWLLKRYTPATLGQETLWSLAQPTWSKLKDMPLSAEQERALDTNFRERYDPASTNDICKYQRNTQEVSSDEVRKKLSLDPSRKTAIIFSHITWDASFFDGDDLYDDYEQWLVETVRLACSNPSLNWIVKLHPANTFKLKRESGRVSEEETELAALKVLGPLPDHVKILRANTDINTLSLYSVVDFGITVRGTVGMELPWMGKPVITAGTGRYTGFGFVKDCPTRDTYEKCLLSLQDMPPVSEEEVALARRHYYWMFLRRHVSFEDVAPMESMIMEKPKHPLHFNVSIRARTIEDIEKSASLNAFVQWFLCSKEPDFVV
jgi:hypothetical protein